MIIALDEIQIIFLGFSIVSLVMSIVFFIKNKGDKVANKLMGLLLFLFFYYLIYCVLFWTDYILKVIHLKLTVYITLALFGPIFYLYTKKILGFKVVNASSLLHLIPLIITLIYLSGFFIQSGETKFEITMHNAFDEYLPMPFVYFDSFLSLTLIFYGIKSFLLFRKIDKNDKDILIWVKLISSVFIGFSIMSTLYVVFWYLGVLTINQDYLLSFLIALFITLVGYFALMQPDVFNGKSINRIVPISLVKYEKTGLSIELSSELKYKLVKLMEHEKIFMKNDITLSDVADLLKVSRNQASQIINENFNLSFYDFMNKYRIIEAQNIINDDLELNFNEVAYTVGFNNRISFYKAFKKFTGLNPTEYSNKLHGVS